MVKVDSEIIHFVLASDFLESVFAVGLSGLGYVPLRPSYFVGSMDRASSQQLQRSLFGRKHINVWSTVLTYGKGRV